MLRTRSRWLAYSTSCIVAACGLACSSTGGSGDEGSAGGGTASADDTVGGAGTTSSQVGGAGTAGDVPAAGTASSGAGDDDVPGATAAEPVGSFRITLHPEVTQSATESASAAYTQVIGSVRPEVLPARTPFAMTASDGDCELWEPEVPFCDPACSGADICLPSGECYAAPSALDVGEVTLSGVLTEEGEDTFTMTALPPGNAYQPMGFSVAYPPFAVGDTVELRAAGGELEAFSAQTVGIEPLELRTTEPADFVSGQPLTIEWVAGGAGSKILVDVDISHHGGARGEVRCSTEDDGSLEIPAGLVTALIDLGAAGYPVARVSREATRYAETSAGPVQLTTDSVELLDLRIPGVDSCVEFADCPSGYTTCNTAKLCE